MRSGNYCRSGKALRITYSECVSVALVIQFAKPMSLLCCQLCHIFAHYFVKATNETRFSNFYSFFRVIML
jgi:hypothetical protein